MGQMEITQSQWLAVMGTTPWKTPDGKLKSLSIEHDRAPANFISRNDALAFCQKLTDRARSSGEINSSQQYSLPTEAEWEYACRAGTNTRFHFGSEEGLLGNYAWWGAAGNGSAKSEAYAHEVGLKKPNRWNVHDSLGNLNEWCMDGYSDVLEGGIDPKGAFKPIYYVQRGGSFVSDPNELRSAKRFANKTDLIDVSFGFRICRTE